MATEPEPTATHDMNRTYADARILIVDDQEPNVRLLHRLLHRQGYSTLHATTDPHKALPLVRELAPDLVLLDLHMPQVSGFDVLESLRTELAPEGYLPILVLTADATPEAKQRALALGAMDFLTKPFDATEVLLRVHNLLQSRFLHLRMEDAVRDRTRELEQARLEILERLTQAVEFRDDTTGEHTRRVGEASAIVARAMGLEEDDVELIRRAAPLHDAGKVAIPDSILLKPDRLTPEEFAVMKTHTTIGARILGGGSSRLIRLAEEIALSHHERWDGRGYPHGLGGAAIPLPARITAAVDFHDALSHDRPYRHAWPRERILHAIQEGAGTHFDPRVAATLLGLIRQGALDQG